MMQTGHAYETRIPRAMLLVAALVLGMAVTASAQDDGDETFVVIKAGQINPITGPELMHGEIILVDGKIRLVGKSLEYPSSARVIDADRLYVMPGMIHARSRWDLPRYSRSGIHGDADVRKEVYVDRIDFDPFIQAGFTAVCFYPNGTGLTGAAAVYHTAGKTASESVGSAYQRITMSSPGRDKKTWRDAISKAKKEIEKVEKAKKEWDEKQKKEKEAAEKKAKEATDKDKPTGSERTKPETEKKDNAKSGDKVEEKKKAVFTPPKIDPAVLPIVEWLRDKKGTPLLFELSRASDLIHLDDVLATNPDLPGTLMYLASSTSPDYHHVVDPLGQRHANIVLPATVTMLPNTVTRYNLAATLTDAGCHVAIVPVYDGRSPIRAFRYQIAELVRSGLSRNAALKAITLYPAEVIGMGDRLGSIEKGKDADLIFLNGDPLNPHTDVVRVMIGGTIVWEKSK